jgi:hypothetical protein
MPRYFDSPSLFQEDILVRIPALMNQVAASEKRMQRLEQEPGVTESPSRNPNDGDPECD